MDFKGENDEIFVFNVQWLALKAEKPFLNIHL